MLLEYCAENFTHIPNAIKQGATRIELCDNLSEGGTTPSVGVIEQTVNYVNKQGATVVTIIRPRGGHFVYSDIEYEIMKKDLKMAKELGVHGVVFGSLTKNNRINRKQIQELTTLSGDMDTVFHMAFNHIPKKHQKEEMDWLIEQGVTRILTHGGVGGSVFDHANWLQELIAHADGRIEILIGGGVNYKNLGEITDLFTTSQFHGTKIVDLQL